MRGRPPEAADTRERSNCSLGGRLLSLRLALLVLLGRLLLLLHQSLHLLDLLDKESADDPTK